MFTKIKSLKFPVVLIALLAASYTGLAQAPANDDCANAQALVVNPNTTCTTSATGTTVNATASTAPAPTCGIVGGANDDVWYSFVATSASHIITLSNITGTSTDLQIATYSGACGSLTEVQCSSPVVTTVGGLTVGNTYYVRVYTNSAATANTANFTICITTPPPPPANDECSGAILLTANAGATCATQTAGTTVDATPSSQAAPTCSSTGINDDVWYSFVAVSTVQTVTLSSVSPTNTMSIALYSGASCTALTQINCIDGNVLTVSSLTVGTTYYVRVYTQSATIGTASTFNICVTTPPPPPANDDPCNAITLTPSTTCTYATYTNQNATASGGVPAPGCANYLGGDVWFQVTVPAGGSLLFDTQTGVITDGGMAIYSGTCNALTLIACDDDSSPNGFMPMIAVTGQTPGTTLWVRVWEYGNNNNGTFGICVTVPPPPPANDECAGAISAPVNPTLTCTSTVNGSTGGSTGSTVTAPSCSSAAAANDDVWFSFIATGATHVVTLSNVTGSTTAMALAVYSGTCASASQVACTTGNSLIVFGLTGGQTYYVRVWTTSTSTPLVASASFTLCVATPPPPPTNDNCSSAISLLVSSTNTCATQTAGTTSWATPSTVPIPTCGTAAQLNDDVWFSFVATAPYHTVSTSSASSTVYFAVYSGTCGTLTQLVCSTIANNTFSGLTVGQTYYVRVWTLSTLPTTFATFNICVSTPPPPPANDDPCNAILLTAAADGSCTYQTFTTQSATGSTIGTIPGCANYQGGDVWFKVVVPCTGSLNFDTQTGVVLDGGMALYTGTCNNLSIVSCNDNGSPNGLMPAISANNLTPGSTVYIRFWEYGNDVTGTFGICASVPFNSGLIPSGACGTQVSLCAQNPVSYTNTTNVPSTGSCGGLGSNPNPAWFTLQVTQSGEFHFTISQTNTLGNGIDVDYAMWGPFANYAAALAACPTLCSSTAVSWNYSAQPVEYLNLTNVLAGQYYVLMVTNFANQPGTITFTPGTTSLGNSGGGGTGSQGTPGPNTALTNCCTVSATASVQSVCPGSIINLSATGGVAGSTWSWLGPNCWSSTQQNPGTVMVPTQAGNYVYYVTATGPNGNVCSDTVQVHVIAAPDFGADTTRMACAGSTVNLTSLYNLTGVTNVWTLAGALVANPAAVNVSGTYMVIGSNANGCKDTAYAKVVIDTVQSVVTTTNLTCTTKGSATATPIKGIAPYQYAISTAPTVFQTSNLFSNLPVGNYVITTRDSLGCTTTNNVRIDSINTLTLSVRPDTLLCNGAGTRLTTVSNASSYVWTPATGLSSTTVQSPFALPTVTTTYTVSATLGVCTKTASVKLTVDPGLTVNAGPDVTIMSGDQVTLNATVVGTPSSIAWTPITDIVMGANTLYPNIRPTFTSGSRTYTITVVNSIGCVSRDSTVITVIPYCIKAKNAFTPNGDGINDKWEVYESYDCLKNVSVNVFNRYGSKVYESRNYANNWDGRYEGKPVPDGTYYGVINYTLITGRVVTIRTDINIIR